MRNSNKKAQVDEGMCCGCAGCHAICLKDAIDMNFNKRGFIYPKIDNKKCIGCGLCVKVCPVEAMKIK